MSTILASRVEKPKWFKVSPLAKGRHARKVCVIGFDSEAEHGKPFLFQFALPDGRVDLLDISRRKHAGLYAFAEYLHNICIRKDTEYLVFGFNLQYEYTQLFRDLPLDVTCSPEFTVELTKLGLTLHVLNEKRYSFTIIFGGTKRRVKVIDAMAFLPMSLNEASKIVDIGSKLPKPKEFSRRKRHTPEFIAYAEQDARLTQKLGENIVGWHERGDVSTCISAPMLASRVFRRQYLHGTWLPMPEDLEQYGLNSYHGGKNGYYATRPQQVKDVWSYDIRSAYPEAMNALPCVDHGTWSFERGYKRGAHCIYRASVEYARCDYAAAYQLDGTRISSGERELWITGYELDSILARGEARIHIATRWEFTSICDCGGRSAFRAFVADFYALKRDAIIPAEKAYAKLNMNSLYGKLFQKVPIGHVGEYDLDTGEYVQTDPAETFDYKAGGLYHPPLASLVTGFVRAKIHALEHKYGAIMTSTDGFFATRPPDPEDIGQELGKLDAARGTLRIWRERLYIFTPVGGGKSKYALHGFRGGLETLRRVPLAMRAFTYTATEMVTLKRSRNLIEGVRHSAGEFVTRTFELQPMAAGPP